MIHGDDLVDIVVELHMTRSDPATLARTLRSCAPCLQFHRVVIVRLSIATDEQRALLVCRAPDAESVRIVCRRAQLEFDRIWTTCRHPAAGATALRTG